MGKQHKQLTSKIQQSNRSIKTPGTFFKHEISKKYCPAGPRLSCHGAHLGFLRELWAKDRGECNGTLLVTWMKDLEMALDSNGPGTCFYIAHLHFSCSWFRFFILAGPQGRNLSCHDHSRSMWSQQLHGRPIPDAQHVIRGATLLHSAGFTGSIRGQTTIQWTSEMTGLIRKLAHWHWHCPPKKVSHTHRHFAALTALMIPRKLNGWKCLGSAWWEWKARCQAGGPLNIRWERLQKYRKVRRANGSWYLWNSEEFWNPLNSGC